MNRRQFLGTLIGGVAAQAAVRSWPFRVFSFPAAPAVGQSVLGIPVTMADMWGHGLTPETINAAGFGFTIPEEAEVMALHLEFIRKSIPVIYARDSALLDQLKAEKPVPISWKRFRVPMQS